MATSFFKIFLSKEKENSWLNSMGEKGYKLIGLNDSKYTFELIEGDTFSYSIEYLGFSPKSKQAIEYYEERAIDGIAPVLSVGSWVYFIKANDTIDVSSDVYKKNSSCYFWRAFYMLFFGMCGAIVCGYQAFSIRFLQHVGYDGNGLITTTYEMSQKSGILYKCLNVLRTIMNFVYKMLNAYFKLWTKEFGNSDAVAVISIIAPIAFILLVWGAIELYKYFSYKKLSKTAAVKVKTTVASEVNDYGEQEI